MTTITAGTILGSAIFVAAAFVPHRSFMHSSGFLKALSALLASTAQ